MVKRKARVFYTAFSSYNEIGFLGEGGAGCVFAVEDTEGTKWALKLLDSTRATTEKLKRFKNELVSCSQDRNEHIIRVVDHGLFSEGGTLSPFYVMPYYDSSLRALMKKGLAPDEVLPLYSQLLDGVEAAHLLGVIHRDIKPENVLYDTSRQCVVVASRPTQITFLRKHSTRFAQLPRRLLASSCLS
jgi:serine/threonine protein kinase